MAHGTSDTGPFGKNQAGAEASHVTVQTVLSYYNVSFPCLIICKLSVSTYPSPTPYLGISTKQHVKTMALIHSKTRKGESLKSQEFHYP